MYSAGHVLGSAQVRLEAEHAVWVVTGDYKRCADPSCAPFESVTCDVMKPPLRCRFTPGTGAQIATQIRDWWQATANDRLCCFAMPSARPNAYWQNSRRLAEEEVLLHGAVETVTRQYRDAGVPMTPSRPVSELPRKDPLAGRLILAPPSAHRSA